MKKQFDPVEFRTHAINQCVKDIKEFGYPSVNDKNIFTDEVYKLFFAKMLKEILDDTRLIAPAHKKVIKELLEEIV